MEADGRAVASLAERNGPVVTIVQQLLSAGWWPREYYRPLVTLRKRESIKLADALGNLSMDTKSSCEWASQNLLAFCVTLMFLALVGTIWALKKVQRSQKLSRLTRLSPASSKTLASSYHAHFLQRYRGGNAKFSGIQNWLTFCIPLIF